MRKETEWSDNGMRLIVAREPPASGAKVKAQRGTRRGTRATYVGTKQGLGGVFEIRRKIKIKCVKCWERRYGVYSINTLDLP